MADQQQWYLTVYGGERIWAQVVRPGDSGWDEADEQPPAGTAEERLAYGRYLAGQLESILMAASLIFTRSSVPKTKPMSLGSTERQRIGTAWGARCRPARCRFTCARPRRIP